MINLKQFLHLFFQNKNIFAFVGVQLFFSIFCVNVNVNVYADVDTGFEKFPENLLAFSGSGSSMNSMAKEPVLQESRKSDSAIRKRTLGKSLAPFQIDYQPPEQVHVGDEFSAMVTINTALSNGNLTVRLVTEEGLELVQPETALVFDLAAVKSQTKAVSVEIKLLAKAAGRHYVNLYISSSANSLNSDKPFFKVTSLAVTVLGESAEVGLSKTIDKRKALHPGNGVFTDAAGERVIRINPR